MTALPGRSREVVLSTPLSGSPATPSRPAPPHATRLPNTDLSRCSCTGRKAIKLGEEALALARRILPAGDPHTVGAMKLLVALYKSVDLAEKAAQLEAEIATLSAGK